MSKKMKVVFCGTPQIGCDILNGLITMENVEIVAIISQPDKLIGRNKVLTSTPVKVWAELHDYPCFQPVKIIEIYQKLQSYDFDFLITCAYGQFIPSKILDLAKCEALNVHGSLLPTYRGGAPIQRAIIEGQTTTGVSLIRMVKEMDAGPIFASQSISITPLDTSGSLFTKLGLLGQAILKENLAQIYNHTLLPQTQDESKVTYAPIIKSVEEQIDWSWPAIKIVNLIRGLDPTPIAYTTFNNQRYKIKSAQIVPETDELIALASPPGMVVKIDQIGIVVQTGQGLVRILEIQRPGKKMLPAKWYFTNQVRDINVGTNFDIIKGAN